MEKENYLSRVNSTMFETIGEVFDHTFDFEFLDLVALVILRLEVEENAKEIVTDESHDEFYFVGYDEIAVLNEMDQCLIYNWQQWEIMKHYQTPNTADLGEAFDLLAQDIVSCIVMYLDKVKEAIEKEQSEVGNEGTYCTAL